MRTVVNTAMNLRGFHDVGGALQFLWYGDIAWCRKCPDLHQLSPSAWVLSVMLCHSECNRTTEQQNNTGSSHSVRPNHRLAARTLATRSLSIGEGSLGSTERLKWRSRQSVRSSVTWYQRLNHMSNLHGIRYRRSLRKVVQQA